MEDIIDIIVTETTNLIEITSQPTDEVIDVNIIDNREDITLNVTPTVVEININSLTGNFGVNWGDIDGTLLNQTDLQNALNLKADLIDGKVPSSQLPSYVDDVVEVANYAALPATGETGKIYVTIDTNYIYRWTGSVYVEIKDSSAVWGAITGTLSSQTDLQNALNAKEGTITAGTTAQYWRGDKSFQTLNTTVVPEGTNLYFTNARVSANTDVAANTAARHNAVTIGTANGLSLSNQILSLGLSSSSANGALSSTDWSTFNSKQAALSGTGFVKISGTTISYDNSTYLTTSSASSTYLAKTGGTLTGALNGTTAVFSGAVWGQTGYFSNTTADNALAIFQSNASYHAVTITNSGSGGSALYISGGSTFAGTVNVTGVLTAQSGLANGSGQSFTLPSTTGTLALTSQLSSYLPLSGGTLTGALSGTSISTSDIIQTNKTGGLVYRAYYGSGNNRPLDINIDGANGDAHLTWNTTYNSGWKYYLSNYAAKIQSTNGLLFSVASSGTAGNTITWVDSLALNPSGAATFSSSVTAGAFLTNGASGTAGQEAIRINNNNGYIGFFNSANTTRSGYLQGNTTDVTLTTSTSTPLIFGTANAEKMRITNAGNVGIGTTSPGAKLSVIAGSTSSFSFQVSATSTFEFVGDARRLAIFSRDGGDGTGIQLGYDATANTGIIAGSTNGTGAGIDFYTYNGSAWSSKMRITSSGNVGIGTTAPGSKLHVAGTITQERNLGYSYSQTSTSGTTSIVDTYIDNNSFGQSAMYRISYGGNPNAGGSGAYKVNYVGYISVATGWSGSNVTRYIRYTPIAQFDAPNVGALSLSVFFFNGSTETASINEQSTAGYYIRLKITGYNTSFVGSEQYVYLTKLN